MAKFQYTYQNSKHPINTYDDVLSTYMWIENALKYVSKDEKEAKTSCSISFSSGEMHVDCRNIKDFQKHAFGKVIKVETLYVGLRRDSLFTDLYVFVSNDDSDVLKYLISSEDEILISDVVNALNSEQRLPEYSIQKVSLYYKDNSINIGDGNIINDSIIGTDNRVDNKKVESEKEKWYSKITWHMIVPVIVGVVVAVIIFYLGLN